MDKITDNLFQAIDTLVEAQISKLKYDTTSFGTVQSVSEENSNLYNILIDNNTIVQAYANNIIYNIGDQVSILVPENDYNNKLLILGSYSGAQEDQEIDTDPFNNIVSYLKIDKQKDYGTQDLQTDIGIPWYSLPIDEGIFKNNDEQKYLNISTTIVSEVLNPEIIETENYGLIIILNDRFNEIYGKLNRNLKLTEKEKNRIYYIDSSTFFGNPYSYDDGYLLKTTIKLNTIEPINNISVFRYNQCSNLYISYINFSCQLGYDKNYYTEPMVKIVSNKEAYNIHSSEVNINSIVVLKALTDYKIYPPALPEEENLQLYYNWYRFNSEFAGDEISGPQWELMQDKSNNSLENFILDGGIKEDKIKLIVFYQTEEMEDKVKVGEDIITFANLSNPPEQATAAATTSLEMRIENDSYNGIYNIYGKDQKAATDSINPKFIINYDQLFNWNEERDMVEWIVPNYNSMIDNVFFPHSLDPVYIQGKYYVLQNNEYVLSREPYNSELTYYENIGDDYVPITFDNKIGKYFLNSENKQYVKITVENIDLIETNIQLYRINTKYSEDGEWFLDNNNYIFKTHFINNFSYGIKDYYDPNLTNNMVQAVIKRYYGVEDSHFSSYYLTKILYFGLNNTNGHNYGFSLQFLNNKKGFTHQDENIKNTNSSLEVEGILTDETGQQIQLQDNSIEWSWYLDRRNNSFILDKNISTLALNKVKIIRKNNQEDNFAILQGKVKYNEQDLVAYKPLPFFQNENINYRGPVKIVYNSSGNTPEILPYNTLKLYNDNIEITNLTWIIKEYTNTNQFVIDKNILKPPNLKPTNTSIISIQALDSTGQVLWNQPIQVIINSHDFNYVNAWDGDSALQGDNYLLATFLGAGKKNDLNQFTGIIMGDLKTEANLVKTGLYGFKNGVKQFSLDEDANVLFKINDNNIFEMTNKGISIKASNLDVNASYLTIKANSTDQNIKIYSNNINSDDALRLNLGYIRKEGSEKIYGLDIYQGALAIYAKSWSSGLTKENDAVIYFDDQKMNIRGIFKNSRKYTEGDYSGLDYGVLKEGIQEIFIGDHPVDTTNSDYGGIYGGAYQGYFTGILLSDKKWIKDSDTMYPSWQYNGYLLPKQDTSNIVTAGKFIFGQKGSEELLIFGQTQNYSNKINIVSSCRVKEARLTNFNQAYITLKGEYARNNMSIDMGFSSNEIASDVSFSLSNNNQIILKNQFVSIEMGENIISIGAESALEGSNEKKAFIKWDIANGEIRIEANSIYFNNTQVWP